MKDEQRQKNELLELKRQQQEEERAKMQQSEHRRVNNAFWTDSKAKVNQVASGSLEAIGI